MHRILHERDWRKVCDVRFLAEDTNSPYLVGPNGYFLRDPATRKPLIWDLADGLRQAVRRADRRRPPWKGRFTVCRRRGGPGRATIGGMMRSRCVRRFQLLRDHIAKYAPGMGRATNATYRRRRSVASPTNFVAHAQVGATIEIEGSYAAASAGRHHARQGREQRLGRLPDDLGAHHARLPGRCARSARRHPRHQGPPQPPGRQPAEECQARSRRLHGLSVQSPPPSRSGRASLTSATATSMLVPLSANSPWSAALGPAHLPWLFQQASAEARGRSRRCPTCGSATAPTRRSRRGTRRRWRERIAEFPFTLAFAYTLDETELHGRRSAAGCDRHREPATVAASAAPDPASSSGATRAGQSASRRWRPPANAST